MIATTATETKRREADYDDGSEKDRRNRVRQQLQIDMENYILNQPRGLARLDAQGLAELRAVILRVIDDGDIEQTGWYLSGESEQATGARMRFCDAIQQAIVARTTPALRGSDHDFRPMPQNPQWCAYYGCKRDRDSHAKGERQ